MRLQPHTATYRQVVLVLLFPYFEPFLDALNSRSDVISSIKNLFRRDFVNNPQTKNYQDPSVGNPRGNSFSPSMLRPILGKNRTENSLVARCVDLSLS